MHTFFINTSKRIIDRNDVLFDVSCENRTLIPLNCSIENWQDEQIGYSACVEEMNAILDMYDNVGSNFNLIIFIDLAAMKNVALNSRMYANEYASYMEMMRIMYCRLMRKTIIDSLTCSAREPKEILIMFGAEAQGMQGANISLTNAASLMSDPLHRLAGMPTSEEILKILQDIPTDSDGETKKEKLREAISKHCKENAACLNATEIFDNEFDGFCQDIVDKDSIEEAFTEFVNKIAKGESNFKGGLRFGSIICCLKSESEEKNNKSKTMNRLHIACYVLSCVNENSIFIGEGEKLAPRPFNKLNENRLLNAIKCKKDKFGRAVEMLRGINEEFSMLGLVPTLRSFKGNVFGMDENGAEKTAIVERAESESKKGKGKGKRDEVGIEDRRVIEEVVRRKHNLLAQNGVEYFDSTESFDFKNCKASTADEYIKLAKKLKKINADFMTNVKKHITVTLSNYAGKSDGNAPAALRKRRVSLADSDYADGASECTYTTSNEPEKRPIEAVAEVSETIYNNAAKAYLGVGADRTLAAADFSLQLDWFVTRVRSIQASKRMLKTMLGVIVGLLVAAYVPYLVLQWDAITASSESILVAVETIAGPLMIIGALYAAAILKYKHKYRQAWNELKEKFLQVHAENLLSVGEYDTMLGNLIPTLRWTYDYKLDVEFFRQCCVHARAKLNHHIQMLDKRVKHIGNMIKDIGADTSAAESAEEVDKEAIDYNEAYCAGEKNIAFYTVIDQDFFDSCE